MILEQLTCGAQCGIKVVGKVSFEICYRGSRATMESWEEEQKVMREAFVQKTVGRLNIVNKTQILLAVACD